MKPTHTYGFSGNFIILTVEWVVKRTVLVLMLLLLLVVVEVVLVVLVLVMLLVFLLEQLLLDVVWAKMRFSSV